MTLRVAGGPVRGRRIRGVGDPVLRASGLYLLDDRTRYVRPGLLFGRAQNVYGLQADGSQVPYTGWQVPWEALGVRLDPPWKNFWLSRGGPVAGAFSDGTVNDASGLPCARFTPNAGAQNFPSFGRAPEPFTAANGATVDIALSGYIYPSVPGSVSLDPNIVVEINTSPSANPSYTTLQIASANGAVQSKSLGLGVTEKQPLSITAVAGGFRFEWLLTYTQGATIRNQVLAYVQARTTAGSGSYTADGVSAIQYSMLSASFSSYIVPATASTISAVTVPSFSFAGLNADMGITLGSEYTIGCEWSFATLQSASSHVARVADIGDSNRALLYGPSSTAQAGSIVISETSTTYTVASASSVGALNKQVLRVKANAMRAGSNGVLMAPSGPALMPVGVDRFVIGHGLTPGANVLAGHIRKLWVVPSAGLSDAQLQALSTL